MQTSCTGKKNHTAYPASTGHLGVLSRCSVSGGNLWFVLEETQVCVQDLGNITLSDVSTVTILHVQWCKASVISTHLTRQPYSKNLVVLMTCKFTWDVLNKSVFLFEVNVVTYRKDIRCLDSKPVISLQMQFRGFSKGWQYPYHEDDIVIQNYGVPLEMWEWNPYFLVILEVKNTHMKGVGVETLLTTQRYQENLNR